MPRLTMTRIQGEFKGAIDSAAGGKKGRKFMEGRAAGGKTRPAGHETMRKWNVGSDPARQEEDPIIFW